MAKLTASASDSGSFTLDSFQISRRLGAGGSGEVWQAVASATGQSVALRRIAVPDPDQLQQARNEAAQLKALAHHNLIRLHEVAFTPGHLVLVLELAVGGSLRDLLARRGRLSPGEVSSALSPVGAALDYVHQLGVVHGDVTPGNVLFTQSGSPLLADLGLARLQVAERPVRLTAAYVDPVVARGSRPDRSSDVFMLAATAFHALCGHPVWDGESAAALAAAAAVGDSAEQAERFDQRLADELADLTPAVAELIRRSLSPDPLRRPTAAEFALDLRHCSGSLAVELAAGCAAEVIRPTRVPGGGAHRRMDHSAVRFDRPNFDVSPGARSQPTIRGEFAGEVRRASMSLRSRWRRRRPSLQLGFVAGRRAQVLSSALLLVAGAGAAVTWRNVSAVSAARAEPARALVKTPTESPDGLAATLLAKLDELRERAFAENDPSLLRQVYAAGTLLAQDVNMVASAVPTGCGLVGVRTTFTDVHAEFFDAQQNLAVTSLATLAPSVLICGAATSGAAPGTPATALRITLAKSGGSYRIATQARA